MSENNPQIIISRGSNGGQVYAFEGTGAEIYALAREVTLPPNVERGDGIPDLVRAALEYRKDALTKTVNTIKERLNQGHDDPNSII